MQWSSELTAAIDGLLGEEPGVALLFAPFAIAHAFQGRGQQLVFVDDQTRPKRLRTLLKSLGARSLVRALPAALPFSPRSASALIAVDTLSRWPRPEETLAALAGLLKPGAILAVVERLAEGIAGRAFLRLARPSHHPLAPEALTGLLLNAGFTSIGQSWPDTPQKIVVTSGRLRVFE